MPYTEQHVGHQNTDTSLAGAQHIAPRAKTLRQRVIEVLHASPIPLTTEEIAERVGAPYRSIQPRLSELRNDNRVIDSGQRRIGEYGVQVIAWELV